MRCARAVEERDSEQRRWTQDRRALTDEVKTLKHKYSAAKSVESNVEAELTQKRSEVDRLGRELIQERLVIDKQIKGR